MATDQLPVLTAQQAAERIGIRIETFYRKAGRDEIPGARKVGRIWLVDRETLEKEMELKKGSSGDTALETA
jgi:excisionase family DNA binding protein